MPRRDRCRSEGLLHELCVCVWVLLTRPGVHFVGHQGCQLSFGPGEAADRRARHHPFRRQLERHEEEVPEWPHAGPHARRRCTEVAGRDEVYQRLGRGQGGQTLHAIL